MTPSFNAALPSRRLRTVLEYTVEEEVPPGTVIGSGLAVDSGLTDRHGPEVVASMRFRFLTSPPLYLEMDEVGGLLRTVSRIDREEICGDVERRTTDDLSCSVRLDVAVQPMNYFHIFKVSLASLVHSSFNNNNNNNNTRDNVYGAVITTQVIAFISSKP